MFIFCHTILKIFAKNSKAILSSTSGKILPSKTDIVTQNISKYSLLFPCEKEFFSCKEVLKKLERKYGKIVVPWNLKIDEND